MPMQATTTTPLFAAELTPHRARGAAGIWLAAGVILLVLAAPGLVWLPPAIAALMGLVGLSLCAVGIGLYLSARPGRRRERVTVWPEQIEWQVTDAAGVSTLRRFDPAATRLMLTRDGYERTEAVLLREGSEAFELGSFLSPEDKSSFAKALGSALRRARG